MAKRRLKKGRVAFAMFVVAGTIVFADNVRRDLFPPKQSGIIVSGSFKSDNAQNSPTSGEDALILGNDGTRPTTAFDGVQNLGFSELSIPSSRLSTGALVLIDNAHPAGEIVYSGMTDLNNCKNEYYTLMSDSVLLNEEAAQALNQMMTDYYNTTGLNDFIVYGTTGTYTGSGSLCPEYFPESVLGNTMDLAINGYDSVLTYDGKDEEGWIIDNCTKYGFIVRYPENKEDITSQDYCPWHLRYVGNVHAAIMAEKNFCLEEYIDFLKDYTFDKAFCYNLNGVNYEIYSVESMGDSTPARVPVSGNYTISGNNSDRYIITTVK